MVDGKVLTENVGIMTYFGGGFRQAKHLAEGHLAPGEAAVSTMAWLSNTVHTTYGHLFRPERYADDDAARRGGEGEGARDVRRLPEGDRRPARGAQVVDRHHYTVVDGYLLVFYRWGNRSGYPVKSHGELRALMDRVLARPAVKKVMADEGITLD